jgi:hypothetical protein
MTRSKAQGFSIDQLSENPAAEGAGAPSSGAA